jgi:hypothetical protein
VLVDGGRIGTISALEEHKVASTTAEVVQEDATRARGQEECTCRTYTNVTRGRWKPPKLDGLAKPIAMSMD